MTGHRVAVVLVEFAALLAMGANAIERDEQPSAHPEGAERATISRRIDVLLERQWAAAGVKPAREASDSEFLRRAYLDLTGVIPRVSEVREFLADERADKRARLVDRLLASPRHATHMATTWRNRILPTAPAPERNREAIALQKWLRSRFAKNLRYDNLVGELLVTLGGDELGPALYFQANDLSPEKLAGSAAELFLGVDLHCAQCHDHPYAEWSQRDFWGLAAFFARVQARNDPRMAMRMGAPVRLVDLNEGDVRLPDSYEVVPPKFPNGETAADDARRPRRVQLALWMTSRENRYFARAAVNWAWGHLFGRGLAESLNDADGEPQSVRAQLLDELAEYFVDSGYDLRELWRTLANTQAYRLSSQYDASEPPRPDLFARMLAKPLTPEQLYDSFQVLAPQANSGSDRASDMASSLDEDPLRLDFVRRMRSPSSDRTEYSAGTLQALMLMNGAVAAGVSAPDTSSVLGALGAPFMSDGDRVEALFLATLARQPAAVEREACIEMLHGCATTEECNRAISDILWALVNSTEFAFNH